MRIFACDFETTPFDYSAKENYELKPLFCCFIDIESKERFYFDLKNKGTNQIKEFILNKSNLKNPARFYFHNLRFDIAFLYDLLPNSDEYKYKIIRANSKIIQFKIFKEYKIKTKEGKIRIQKKTLLDIRDTLVIFPTSVEKLGKSFNLEKMEIEYTSEITDKYIEYCFRDVEILVKALENLVIFCQEVFDYQIDLVSMPLTLPSLAKRIFHYLNPDNIRNLYDTYRNSYEKEIREYYYGGRVEVFDFNECVNGHYNDYNSHNPAIMVENEFPLAPYKSYECNNQELCWIGWNENKMFFGAICEITEQQHIPLIATKINDKLVFANGVKKCFLFRKEIEYLLELKQKVKIITVYECSSYAFIFKEFILKTYALKQKYSNESFEYLFAKLLMNSLYGKFAEKIEKESIEILHSIIGLSEKELNLISINDDKQDTFLKREIVEHHTLKTNIFFSMMITALARLKLHKSIVNCKDTHYVDTDSIVSKNLIENSLILGHLKPEFTFSRFQALGCKEYALINDKNELIVKMKGFGKLIYDDMDKFITEYKEKKLQNRLIGFIEAFNREKSFSTMLVFTKEKRATYDKRIINDDLTTRPISLGIDDFELIIKNNEKLLDKIINSSKKTYEKEN